MSHSRCWTVEIVIDEHTAERRTHAQARLLIADWGALRGDGTAWRDPLDAQVPAVGDQIATARALADLARQLMDEAAGFAHRSDPMCRG